MNLILASAPELVPLATIFALYYLFAIEIGKNVELLYFFFFLSPSLFSAIMIFATKQHLDSYTNRDMRNDFERIYSPTTTSTALSIKAGCNNNLKNVSFECSDMIYVNVAKE